MRERLGLPKESTVYAYDKERLESAIITVCTTKYKKDAPDEHRYVEAFGYEIYKKNGAYGVYNPNTGKIVKWVTRIPHCIIETSYKLYGAVWFNKEPTLDTKYHGVNIRNINVLDYLNTTKNTFIDNALKGYTTENTWCRKPFVRYKFRKYLNERYYLDEAKRDVKRLQDSIDYHLKEIAKCQKDLAEAYERIAKEQTKFDEYKKSVGLGKGASA